MNMTQNSILITGGTSGIGLALAKKLTEKGNNVAVLGRSEEKLTMVQEKYPDILTFKGDVTNLSSLIKLKEWLMNYLPNLNIIINSAGVMNSHNLLNPDLPLENLLSDIEINLIGTIAVNQLFLSQLMKQEEAMIVNISSGLAYLSSAAHPTYSASKSGVQMYTSALRNQLNYAKKEFIHVMELVPPLVAETGLQDGNLSGTFGNMSLDALVKAALKGMEKNKKRVNAGAAKQLHLMGQVSQNKMETIMAKESLKQAFPKGL
ncbi:SDR family oxidoreductase [Enterococcus sp. LJL128]